MEKVFEAKLVKSDRLTYIEIPFNPSEEFNSKGNMELRVTVNNVSLNKKLLSRGNGEYILTFNKDMIKKMGIDIGETVSVALAPPKIVRNGIVHDDFIAELYEDVREKKEKLTNLSILEAVFTRRSIRNFKKDKIEDTKITTLLKAGAYAPTAENKRHLEFLVIRDEATLHMISDILPRGKMINKSGCAIVVCGNGDIQKQKGFLVADCSASIQNILLTAHGIGLAAVWCGVYPISKYVKEIKSSLDIPSNIVPVGIVAVGYSDEEKIIADKYDLDKVHTEKW